MSRGAHYCAWIDKLNIEILITGKESSNYILLSAEYCEKSHSETSLVAPNFLIRSDAGEETPHPNELIPYYQTILNFFKCLL